VVAVSFLFWVGSFFIFSDKSTEEEDYWQFYSPYV
jgi:hypothetical protein